MPKPPIALATLLLALAGVSEAQPLPPVPVLTKSPWIGDRVVSRARNAEEIKAAAADSHRFHLAPDGRIRGEITSLNEVVEDRTDGRPMPIRRTRPTPLTLAVSAEGLRMLVYRGARDGKPEGGGRLTLVDQGKAWIDISQPTDRPDLAGAVVYVRPDTER